MEKKLSLSLGGTVIGSVTCGFDGLHAVFRAECVPQTDMLARAYVRGGGGQLLIGVLAPDGALMTAKRTASKSVLAEAGLTFEAIDRAYVIVCGARQPSAAWLPLSAISERLSRHASVSALARFGGTLTDNPDSPSRLAVPLAVGKPFPRPDLLCIMSPAEIDGSPYAVIAISDEGEPKPL